MNQNTDKKEIKNTEITDLVSVSHIKTTIYPFIDEMVNTFYTENCNNFIKNSIEHNNDKSIFLMFIMMYFGIHLKMETENDALKKDQIKIILSDLVRDPEKRKLCIEMFENKINHVFHFSDQYKVIKEN